MTDGNGKRLAERTVLITGAGRGLGRATALACAAEGATVVLLGRTVSELEAVYDEIETQGGPQPAIYPMNLEGATLKDYDDLATTLQQAFGRLDGLVNNAALLGSLTPLEHYDPETWAQCLHVNLTAPFLLTQRLLPLLRASDQATVLFISDRVGREGRAFWGAYGASKWGIEGLMREFADELDNTPIRICSVDPGPLKTRLRERAYPAEDRKQLAAPETMAPRLVALLAAQDRAHHGSAITLSADNSEP